MTIPRVGIISATGTGRKRTIPALQTSTMCKVTAVHGRDKEKVNELASSFGIPHAYSEISKMISDANFDIAIVCSPPFLHREQISELLDAGYPVLSEKPLALKEEDAKHIKELSALRSKIVLIAHHLRHQNTYAAIKEAIEKKEIGEIQSAFFEWSFTMNKSASNAQWKMNPELNGYTSLSDAGIHCIDTAIGLFGSGEFRGACSSGCTQGGTFESCDIFVLHSGIQVTIRASRLYGPFSNQLLISGTKGEILAPLFFTERSAEYVNIMTERHSRIIKKEQSNPYKLEVEDFVRATRDPNYFPIGTRIDDALNSCKIILDAEKYLLDNMK